MRIVCLVLGFLLAAQTAWSQSKLIANKSRREKDWVDSVYNSLEPDERIGQLFMVAAYSSGPKYNEEDLTALLLNRQVGGLIFMQGSALNQARLTNKYQRLANVPLFIAMDAEWGLGMRLDSVMNFPRQMMFGAARDTALMYQVGMAIAYQCKRMGVHINFAPVVDINNNPDNPVIGTRSFGEDKYRVAELGRAYMNGLQDNGVMACLKHFPGHGNTNVDSHKDLPVLHQSVEELYNIELYPFRQLIREGAQSIMVAHLEVPALEPRKGLPSTLSSNIITALLKDEMKFKGLVFTDALNMEGVTKYFEPGEADYRAFLAGNDVLLFSQDVPVAIRRIRNAIDSGVVSEFELEVKVKKILTYKYRYGLSKKQYVDPENLPADLNRYTAALRSAVSDKGGTIVCDHNFMLNALQNKNAKVQYIIVNSDGNGIQKIFSKAFPQITFTPVFDEFSAAQALQQMNDFDVNIVGVHGLSASPANNYNLKTVAASFLNSVQQHPKGITVWFGSPYLLRDFCNSRSALVMYDDDSLTRKSAAEILSGNIIASGILPVKVCPRLAFQAPPAIVPAPASMTNVRPLTPAAPKTNEVVQTAPQKQIVPSTQPNTPFAERSTTVRNTQGTQTPARQQGNEQAPAPAQKTLPYSLNNTDRLQSAKVTNPDALLKLDMFMKECLARNVFPGARVLAMRNGTVIYDKAFGYLDETKHEPVKSNSMYDVASLTKILGTNLAVMKLYEDGDLDLNKRLSDYLPFTIGTDKARISIRDLLLHQAGLKSWIPFYKETLNPYTGALRNDLYHNTPGQDWDVHVARNLYLRNDYVDTVWKRILKSPIEIPGKYTYSDLDFYFLQKVVERISGKPLDVYLQDNFYDPMGLRNILYNPLAKFPVSVIAPTEKDEAFRKQQLRGFVHDQGAAMLGGVAGHAGLFATAQDVAAIFEMLRKNGMYNNKRILQASTVEKFTAYNSRVSRRGLGFDKPSQERNDGGPCSNRCSGAAYGHQGFTGTCAWADPATGIVFVFLSNRVCPDADNNAINKLSVRTYTQDLIYDAFGLPENRNRPEYYLNELKNLGK